MGVLPPPMHALLGKPTPGFTCAGGVLVRKENGDGQCVGGRLSGRVGALCVKLHSWCLDVRQPESIAVPRRLLPWEAYALWPLVLHLFCFAVGAFVSITFRHFVPLFPGFCLACLRRCWCRALSENVFDNEINRKHVETLNQRYINLLMKRVRHTLEAYFSFSMAGETSISLKRQVGQHYPNCFKDPSGNRV